MKKLLFFITILFIISCNKKDKDIFCPNYDINTKVYQCHNHQAFNFLFLSKYKNLESLDLTGTKVQDLSFLTSLRNLRVLLLIDTNVNSFKYITKLKNLKEVYLNKTPLNKFMNIFKFNKYNSGDFKLLLKNNQDLFFSLVRDSKKLNLLKYSLNDISGVIQLDSLKVLKLHLKTDKYIQFLERNQNLEELHLSGNIKKLPDFTKLKKLKILFLYNTKIKDFSFLSNSNIDSLHISTKDFKNDKWINLMDKYPNVDIYMKNSFSIPNCDKVYPSLLPYNSRKGLTFKIQGACWYGYGGLASDILDFNFNLEDTKFLIKRVGINYIWSNQKTFLDNAIKYNNIDVVNYLKLNNAKKGCEILKIKCN